MYRGSIEVFAGSVLSFLTDWSPSEHRSEKVSEHSLSVYKISCSTTNTNWSLQNTWNMLQNERILTASRTWRLVTSALRCRVPSTSRVPSTRPLSTHTEGPDSKPRSHLPCLGVRSRMTDRRELSTTSRCSSGQQKFRLKLDTMNPCVKNMEYAVRGKLPLEAAKIDAEIKKVS